MAPAKIWCKYPPNIPPTVISFAICLKVVFALFFLLASHVPAAIPAGRISAEYPDVRLTPYMLCAEYCCIYASCIAKRKKHWPPVSIVFEAGPKHNSPTFNHFRVLLQSTQFREDHKINSIAWQNKKGMIPFQFSDMFVYELYKLHVARAKHGKLARIRHPLREFDKYVEYKGKLLLEEAVREYYNLYHSFVRAHGAKYV